MKRRDFIATSISALVVIPTTILTGNDECRPERIFYSSILVDKAASKDDWREIAERHAASFARAEKSGKIRLGKFKRELLRIERRFEFHGYREVLVSTVSGEVIG